MSYLYDLIMTRVIMIEEGSVLSDYMDMNDVFGGVTANLNFAGPSASIIVHPARTADLIGAGSTSVPKTMPASHASRACEALASHVYGGRLVTKGPPSSSRGFGYFTTFAWPTAMARMWVVSYQRDLGTGHRAAGPLCCMPIGVCRRAGGNRGANHVIARPSAGSSHCGTGRGHGTDEPAQGYDYFTMVCLAEDGP